MSNLINTELEERAYEIFEEAACDNSDFRAVLAETFLEGMEYYLFCKDDRSDYLDDNLDGFFHSVLTWNWEETIRNPIEAAYQYAKERDERQA